MNNILIQYIAVSDHKMVSSRKILFLSIWVMVTTAAMKKIQLSKLNQSPIEHLFQMTPTVNTMNISIEDSQ